MVIDFHVHCFPDELAQKAVPELAQCAKIPNFLDGTVSSIKKSMEGAGIDKSVVLSIATKPTQTQRVNNWSAEIQDSEIVAFGSIHPDYENWKDELIRVKELGIKGIKYHPDYQKFYVDEKRMYPVYELAFELGLIVIFHAGIDIGLAPPFHCTPERLLKLVKAFPAGTIVAAHMGSFSCWDDVEKYLVGESLYLDTSYSIGKMEDAQAKRIINNHGYEKILFATDSPWCDQRKEIVKLKEFNLGKTAERAIFGENARALLGF